MSKISVPLSNDYCPQTLFVYGTYTADGKPDFGLFCWFSYCWDKELGVMACIADEKLTKDRIRETGVFSASLVTESLLPLADYLGNTEGYSGEKQKRNIAYEPGRVLSVPVLKDSPLAFELEVFRSVQLDDAEVFLCKVRNVLHDEVLADASKTVEEKMRLISPIHTTCSTYFSWDGKNLGGWSEPMEKFDLPV